MNASDAVNLESVWPLVSTVLIASLFGSLHCAGMCGGLMFFALGTDQEQSPSNRARLQSAYHGGRLITYTLLGIIAGIIGQAIDFGGGFVGIQRGAMMFAGIMMVGFGVITIARIRGIRVKHVSVPAFVRKRIERAQRVAFGFTPFKRALTTGLLTALLPCGWLYAFVFLAAGTAHPVSGGITMAAFWLGTIPVMVSLGAGIQLLSGRLNAKLPMITALAVIVVGLMTAMGGLQVSELTRESLGVDDTPGEVPVAGEVDCPLCETEETPQDQPANSLGVDD